MAEKTTQAEAEAAILDDVVKCLQARANSSESEFCGSGDAVVYENLAESVEIGADAVRRLDRRVRELEAGNRRLYATKELYREQLASAQNINRIWRGGDFVVARMRDDEHRHKYPKEQTDD